MSFAPRTSLTSAKMTSLTSAKMTSRTSAKMQTKMSAWTPLNHQLSNNNVKVFEERRNLLGKWFDKWSDGQRKAVLQDFFSRCSVGQLRFLRQNLTKRVPEENLDFTSVLPRVLSLYVFSFLDPRSLCRCAQVSWHWKGIVELDQQWMPKCLKLGWCINFAPTPFEHGVWKRHYIETVLELHIGKPKTLSQQEFIVPEVMSINSVTFDQSESFLREVRSARPVQQERSGGGTTRWSSGSQLKGLPPWRGADRHPTDTVRFNYLENLDPIEHAHQAKVKSRGFFNTYNENKKELSAFNYKLRKAKSLMFLSLDLTPGSGSGAGQQKQNRFRPQWATQSLEYPVTKSTAKSLSRSSQWNAGIRPGPVRPAVPRLSQEGLRASNEDKQEYS
ncbi:F-box only protein 16 isoform X1 [Oncorhynchus keta]|uniref:F-box only protein 16 isoform X1 n=1 Tax=Oncorhynchus keta TaxID=8018 RepID=UPI0015FE2172|nr:F-box only protein 16 isoform X1 [Oncorhynchus keta]XP_035649681.1 F-box only protein 16 isoform X1 [Oncorhynchus keta]